ncbi:hypothetical protein LEMLEM_LOCUS10032 [Lemmus lemmus]
MLVEAVRRTSFPLISNVESRCNYLGSSSLCVFLKTRASVCCWLHVPDVLCHTEVPSLQAWEIVIRYEMPHGLSFLNQIT